MKKLLLFLIVLSQALFAQNTALQFDGQEEKLTISHSDIQNIGETFTIEAWIFATEWKQQAYQGSIVAKDGSGPDRGFAFRCGDNGKLSFVMSVNNSWVEAVSPAVMNIGQWHHVAATVNNGAITLYIDGSPSGTASFSGTYTDSNFDLTIGESSGFSGRYFNGVIDEVRLWETARTETELIENASIQLQGNEAGLKLYFPMNEGSGQTATDLIEGQVASLVNMDNENWVDGFVLAEFDIALKNITVFDNINAQTRPVKVQVELENLGANDIGTIFLTTFVNGEEVATDYFPEIIAVNSKKTYTLSKPIDLTQFEEEVEVTVSILQAEDENTLNNSATAMVKKPQNKTIKLYEQELHNFGNAGQNRASSFVFPARITAIDQLLLHISLDCPAGGCDPWDQPANFKAITNAGTFELARYITPYGKACGVWTVDITDFKSILQGEVNFNSYIQVWGQNGWLVNIDLEMIDNNTADTHSQLHRLWESDYWIYGDPNISHDLEEKTIQLANQTSSSHIRMTMSGHGQANTDNAAEFSPKTHDFVVNNEVINEHYLWKDDCDENECSNQAGTWLYSRAGWCPGQQVIPYIVNTNNLAAGSSNTFDYELEDYTNFLNTGYNGSSHTEPHYRIWSYFVEESTQPFIEFRNLVCDSVYFDNNLAEVQVVIRNNGTQNIDNYSVRYFANANYTENKIIEETIAAGETRTHSFPITNDYLPTSGDILYGVAELDTDENLGDDVFKSEPISVTTNTATIDINALKIYPNPTQTGDFTMEITAAFLGGSYEIYSLDGKLISSKKIESLNLQERITRAGVYYINLSSKNGTELSKKVVVLE